MVITVSAAKRVILEGIIDASCTITKLISITKPI